MKHGFSPACYFLLVIILSSSTFYAMPPALEKISIEPENNGIQSGKPPKPPNNNDNHGSECDFTDSSPRTFQGDQEPDNSSSASGNPELFHPPGSSYDDLLANNREVENIPKNNLPSTNLPEKAYSTPKKTGPPQSDQEKFEDILLSLIKREEANPLNGIELVQELAKETTITFPFHNPELQNYSLKNLARDISEALTSQKNALQQNLDSPEKSTQYFKEHQSALESGAQILFQISEKPTPEIIKFFDTSIAYLDKSFRCYQEAFDAEKQGHVSRVKFLLQAGDAFWNISKEEAALEPREVIINGYKKSSDLFEQAVKAELEGKMNLARYLNNQGAISFFITRANATGVYQDIIDDFVEISDLFKQAVEAELAREFKLARYLENQGKTYLVITKAKKLSVDQKIINNYLKAYDFFEQAVKAESAEEVNLAKYYNNQGATYFLITEMLSKSVKNMKGSNQKIIKDYYEVYNLFKQAVEAELEDKFQLASYINDAGMAGLFVIKIKKYDPDQKIIDYYLKSFVFFKNIVEAELEGKVQLVSYLKEQVEAQLGLIEEKIRPEGPRDNIINLYLESLHWFKEAISILKQDDWNPLAMSFEASSFHDKAMDFLRCIETEKKK